MIDKVNKVGQNDLFKQQFINDDIGKKKAQEQKDKAPEPKKLESNPAAFTASNANKVLDKAEGIAESNKLPDMSQTKNTLKSAFNDILSAFKSNKSDLDSSTKSELSDVTSKVEPDRTIAPPKLKDPNKVNTGASLEVKAVQKDSDNIMDNLSALNMAKAQTSPKNNLEEQNKQAQVQAV